MEQALKARSLSSASARRKRIQQRQEEREKIRSEARQRALALHDLSDQDESESASASDDNMAASDHSREDSVETLSEYSPMTPNDTPQPLFDRRVSIGDAAKPGLHIIVPGRSTEIKMQKPRKEPSPGPKLQASLTNLADFHYDRFSMFVDTPVDVLQSPISESDEPETPCEFATPITYTLPQTRPAVISITSNKKRRPSSSSSSLSLQPAQRSATMPPVLPTRSSRRLSQVSNKSGFLASEAAPLSVPELPQNAMYLIANASRDSLAISTHSTATNEPFQRPVQTRKNSMPLLSAAFKSGHSRLSSIRGLVSPTIPSPASSISHTRSEKPSRHHAQPSVSSLRPRTAITPSTPADDLSFETVPADLHNLPPPRRMRANNHRPSTSHASARAGSVYSMTALPSPPATTDAASNSFEQSQPYSSHILTSQSRESATPSPELSMRRKKSFSALRKRSESISNAIKFVKKGSSSQSPRDSQPPPPPMPTISRTSTTGNMLDVSRPTTARSSSTGAFMGYGSSNTTGPSHTTSHVARKSIDIFKSFGSGSSSTSSRPEPGSTTPYTTTSRPTTATMPRSSLRPDSVASTSPVTQQQQQTKRNPTSYSVFPSSRGEHGRSMIGLGIRT